MCVIDPFLSAPEIHLSLSHIITNTSIRNFTVPDPGSLYFCLFIDTIVEHQWSNRVLHHNFRSAVNSATERVPLFKKLSQKGGDLLGSIVKVCSDNRPRAASLLLDKHNSIGMCVTGRVSNSCDHNDS